MTVLRMTIRRPPRCRRCNGVGFEHGRTGMFGTPVACESCKGRSAKVECFVEYGPISGMKAVWEDEESGPYAVERI